MRYFFVHLFLYRKSFNTISNNYEKRQSFGPFKRVTMNGMLTEMIPLHSNGACDDSNYDRA